MVTANMGSEKPPVVYKKGLVKFVNSGDSINLITDPKTRQEYNFIFSSVMAPKLARRPRSDAMSAPSVQPDDAPYAWEAREFLRQRIIGKIVWYTVDKDDGNRKYGTLYYPEKEDNVTELMIAEGWVDLRSKDPTFLELESRAKGAGKGKHSTKDEPSAHVRHITWDPEPKHVLEKFGKKMTKAVIDNINPGLTMRAFLLPDHYYVAFCLSGIKIVREPDEYGHEVRTFLEERVLQRDVTVIIESVQNEKNKVMNATLIHEGQKMNIGELLVREGFASCNTLLQGVYDEKKLREAEKKAQNERKRRWANYVPKKPPKERQAVVHEIINGDGLMIKYVGETKEEKVFLSSIKPPRPEAASGDAPLPGKGPTGRSKPLYEVPWLYEAREFLRTRLIGKKVNVSEDFVQEPREKFPEKKCVSVFIGQENIAEALVSKGLATVVRYKEDEENKSPHYEKLRQAEEKAEKSQVGLHSKKDNFPVHRVNDVSTDSARAKAMFPSLQRTSSIEGVVEFVASGSRFRIYIDRETCLITFLLGGIDCPRASRPAGPNPKDRIPSEAFGEEALEYVKKLVLQRTVELKVETMDKRGGMIGWMFVNNMNLSVELVEQGFARVHETAERSQYARQLKAAEERAKGLKLRRWENYSEEEELKAAAEKLALEEASFSPTAGESSRSDRAPNYIEAVVCVVTDTPELALYVQKVSEANKIDSLMSRLRQEFAANSPVLGAYTPKRNDICAAKFAADGEWYRAKVEKVQGRKANIFYIDYGNRDVVEFSELTFLPDQFQSEPGYAHEYKFALIKLPPEDYRPDSIHRLQEELENRKVLLNVEYNITGTAYVTVLDAASKTDLMKSLVATGFFLVDPRRDRRVQKLVAEYDAAQQEALKKRYNMWEYGDIREDDDRDFRN